MPPSIPIPSAMRAYIWTQHRLPKEGRICSSAQQLSNTPTDDIALDETDSNGLSSHHQLPKSTPHARITRTLGNFHLESTRTRASQRQNRFGRSKISEFNCELTYRTPQSILNEEGRLPMPPLPLRHPAWRKPPNSRFQEDCKHYESITKDRRATYRPKRGFKATNGQTIRSPRYASRRLWKVRSWTRIPEKTKETESLRHADINFFSQPSRIT